MCPLWTKCPTASQGPSAFGFMSDEDFSTMLNTSICSLATSVCVAQKGYCLLDDNNQLQERPPAEIVFLSACAPDFLEPDTRPNARQELQKYFVPPNKTGKWRSHGAYHGRHALMMRIMDIWHRVFTACADQDVTHPSLLPMGLGIFRPRVAEPDAIPLYFEVCPLRHTPLTPNLRPPLEPHPPSVPTASALHLRHPRPLLTYALHHRVSPPQHPRAV